MLLADSPNEEADMSQHPDRQAREMAYFQIKTRFDLKAAQRDKLDASDQYRAIITAAHNDQWNTVESLLRSEGIIR